MADNWFDPTYKLRYGVGADEKHDIAMRGAVPGGQDVRLSTDPAALDREERRAAAYLFGKQHPIVAPAMTAIANVVRSPITSAVMPLLTPFADDPRQSNELHALASNATAQGVADAKAASAPQQAAAIRSADPDELQRTMSGAVGTRY